MVPTFHCISLQNKVRGFPKRRLCRAARSLQATVYRQIGNFVIIWIFGSKSWSKSNLYRQCEAKTRNFYFYIKTLTKLWLEYFSPVCWWSSLSSEQGHRSSFTLAVLKASENHHNKMTLLIIEACVIFWHKPSSAHPQPVFERSWFRGQLASSDISLRQHSLPLHPLRHNNPRYRELLILAEFFLLFLQYLFILRITPQSLLESWRR